MNQANQSADTDCIFCKIVDGRIPVDRLYEDDHILAFPDREPQAPTHILVIPKTHLASHADAQSGHQQLLGRILTVAAQLGRDRRLDNGYRLVINCGEDGGQAVPHLHLHLLAGRKLSWPPG